MAWIARTNGATTGEAAELREGELTDIAPGDRGNWRVVNNDPPSFDRLTEQFVRIGLPIASNGTVTVEWDIIPEPVAVAKLKLSQLAHSVANEKLASARVERNGKQVRIDTATLTELSAAQAAITAGHIAAYSVVTAEGDVVSVNGTQLGNAINAIADAREAIYTARATVIAAVMAGTVTSTNGVRTHAAWPA